MFIEIFDSKHLLPSTLLEIYFIFTGFDIHPPPSVSITNIMIREAKVFCNMQLNEVIESSDNLTLLKDATIKQGRQFYGAKINSNKVEYTSGIHD